MGQNWEPSFRFVTWNKLSFLALSETSSIHQKNFLKKFQRNKHIMMIENFLHDLIHNYLIDELRIIKCKSELSPLSLIFLPRNALSLVDWLVLTLQCRKILQWLLTYIKQKLFWSYDSEFDRFESLKYWIVMTNFVPISFLFCWTGSTLNVKNFFRSSLFREVTTFISKLYLSKFIASIFNSQNLPLQCKNEFKIFQLDFFKFFWLIYYSEMKGKTLEIFGSNFWQSSYKKSNI